jgi:hypothetical protein
MKLKIPYYLIPIGLGLLLLLGTPWVLKVEWSVNEKNKLTQPEKRANIAKLSPVNRACSRTSSFTYAPIPNQEETTINRNIEYLLTLNTGGLEKWEGKEVVSKDVVYQEGGTYAIRTILRKADDKKLLLMETFSQDLNLLSEKVYKADVVEIDVLPSHYPGPPMYPPPPKGKYKKTVPRSKSNRDLQRLGTILNQNIEIILTGTSWGITPPEETQTSLNEGYHILVTAPNTPQEIFNLYEKLQEIAGDSGMVRLQKP